MIQNSPLINSTCIGHCKNVMAWFIFFFGLLVLPQQVKTRSGGYLGHGENNWGRGTLALTLKSRLNHGMEEKGIVLPVRQLRRESSGSSGGSPTADGGALSGGLPIELPRRSSPTAPAGELRLQSGSSAGLPGRQSHGKLTN